MTKLFKLNIHFVRDVAENVKHHRNDDVKDNPLDKDVEDHEEDAWPYLTTGSAHHVSDGWPVIDDHERIQSDNARAEVIEVDKIVHVVGDTVLTVESGLLDFAAEAIDANHGEDIEDDVEAGELVEQR